MVPDLYAARRAYMFIDELEEPLHGLVKSTKPTTLQDAIERARDLQDALLKSKARFQQKPTFPSKGNMRRIILQRRAKKTYLLVMMSKET